MLILNRTPGQTLKIGEEITVHVIAIEKDRVLLGFQAPDDVKVERLELTQLERPTIASRELSDTEQN